MYGMLLGKCDLGFMWKRRVIEEPSVGTYHASLMLIRIILPFILSLLHFSSAFTSSSYPLLMYLLVLLLHLLVLLMHLLVLLMHLLVLLMRLLVLLMHLLVLHLLVPLMHLLVLLISSVG